MGFAVSAPAFHISVIPFSFTFYRGIQQAAPASSRDHASFWFAQNAGAATFCSEGHGHADAMSCAGGCVWVVLLSLR
eukprot:scaffold235605_cov15-Tisochrysis_lutea.AAC.1